jgi:Glycosyl transferase family 41/Galactosyltransferase/Glycosyl transferase family 2
VHSPPFPPPASPPKRARIRIGYLSADMHEHATAYLLAQMFELHDRDRFEVFVYSYGPDDRSPMRRRLRGAVEHFIDVRSEAERRTAERIRADGIDVLVDLKGYTTEGRAEILAYRPAPIQVSHLGYPGTLGASHIDYLVSDPIVSPRAHEADYAEKLAWLPHSYQPNDRTRVVNDVRDRAAAGLPEEAFVYCSFNNTYKITPQVFDTWCRILHAVPGALLWLLDANLQAKHNLWKHAEARGIARKRIVFAPRMPQAQHLARICNADLFLDNLPVNAHTTASDALWAGVPVLTAPGATFVSRVTASLVAAAGVPELAVASLAEYEAQAIALARDPARLQALRQRLRDGRGSSPLFDSNRYTRNLEALFARMVERAQAGLAPDHLEPQDAGQQNQSAAKLAEQAAAQRVIADIDRQLDAEARAERANSVFSHQRAPLLARKAGALAAVGDADAALAQAADALAQAPDDVQVLATWRALVTARRPAGAARPIGLVISCEKYFARALRTVEAFARFGLLDLRIVVGRDAKVEHPQLLRVDAADDYESLPHKVRAAFTHVYANEPEGACVFKIDDDLDLRDPPRVARLLTEIVASGKDYVGFEVGGRALDRSWHWRKCRTPELNRRAYGKRCHGSWANGPFYFLSARALAAFAEANQRFPAEIDGEFYEDKFVGDTLRAEGIGVFGIDPRTSGLAADNLWAPGAQAPRALPLPADARAPQEPAPVASVASAAQSELRIRRVTVITPYFKEPRRMIERAIASVRAQAGLDADVTIDHIVVAEGHPQDWIDGAGVRHLRLDRAHGDYGNTPRAIAGLMAVAEGTDAICFLDADNWFDPQHLARCFAAAKAADAVDFVVARRRLMRDDGTELPVTSSEDDPASHIDTNCYFLLPGAFHTLARWALMPRELAIVGDRIVRMSIHAEGLRYAVLDGISVNYLCTWRSFFEAAGETPPDYAKPDMDTQPVLDWWQAQGTRSRTVIDRLLGASLNLH